MLSLDVLKFDGNLFAGDDVGACVLMSYEFTAGSEVIHTQVNITETATTDLATNAVLVTDTQILCKMLDRGKTEE